MVTRKVHLRDSSEALILFGQHDTNLRLLENHFGVQIFGRGDILSVRGAGPRVERALEALDEMRAQLARGLRPSVAGASIFQEQHGNVSPVATSASGKNIYPQTANQRTYVRAVEENDLVVAIGPAGTGKTFLAVACAIAAFKANRVSRIVLTRPVVEAGEKLGFLPGDLYEKVNPYLKPLYDCFNYMLGPDRFRAYREDETIEIVPLAYMRGRTLDEVFMILDEAQNTTPEQMKMFLTRMGAGSRAVVTGDITQIDLERGKESSLVNLPRILDRVPGVAQVRFDERDVMRHPLVREILKAYERWESGGKHP